MKVTAMTDEWSFSKTGLIFQYFVKYVLNIYENETK